MPALLSLLLLLYSFTLPHSVNAQSTGELSSQLVQAGTAYRTSYSQYLQAKNQHLQYNTASTRGTAIENTVDTLAKRNTWQIAYLKYIRQTLSDVTNIANYPQTVAFLDLEVEATALGNLSYNLGELDSFDKVTAASKIWETRLAKADKLTSASKMQIASARLLKLQTKLEDQLQSFQNRVGTPSGSLKSTLDLIIQKLASSTNSRQKIDLALNARTDTTSYKSALQLVHQDLQEASRLLLELTYQNP